MTSSYRGPAVIIGDGFEISVQADLTGYQDSVDVGRLGSVAGLQGWTGHLVADDYAEDFWALRQSVCMLRLDDGRELGFMADSGFTTNEIHVTGSDSHL